MNSHGDFGYYGNGWGAANTNGGYERDQPMGGSRRSQNYDDYHRDTYDRHSPPHKSSFRMEEPGLPSSGESSANKGQRNFNSLYTTDDGRESNSESQGPKKKAVIRIFQRFAENCSMQGPPYIRASTWWFSRSAWVVLFVLALAAMSFHLYYLCQIYFDYPVKNNINLGWSSLQFPSVTVCNVNPVRKSKLSLLSEDFRQLITLTDPVNLGNIIDKFTTTTGKKRRKRQVTDPSTLLDVEDMADDDFFEDELQLDDIEFDIPQNFTNARERVDTDTLDGSLDGFGGSWEGEAQESQFSRIEREFKELYAAEYRSTRIQAGHKLGEMLISCSFGGKSCYPNNFTLTTSMSYGNCYTLQYDKFISRQSGPSGGLELLFFLDRDEYIRGVTPDDGLQVTVHAPGTKPFPSDEGLAVSSGTHTLMALKLIQIERYGKPYSTCTSHKEFRQQYGVRYTRQTCQNLCKQKQIHSRCACRDETEENMNFLMKANSMKPCRTLQDMRCLLQAQWDYSQGRITCDCESPCLEYKYEKTMSSRPWPHKEYAKGVLASTVCKRDTAAKCNALRTKTDDELRQEFVKLNIFYEDLNYENITESPDYEDVQFISDLGGTVGLWIGLSILSVAEVMQLFVELARYLICCRWREGR